MAKSAVKNLAAAATHDHTRTTQYQQINGETISMSLLDTLKSMTNTCNKRMQDINDCRDAHQTMLETGHAYPAYCELDRMDCMAVRVRQYWQRMRDMWIHHNTGKCPKKDLDEIAINVTNLGNMVDQLVRGSQDYSKFYQETGHKRGDKQTQVTDDSERHKRQGGPTNTVDEYGAEEKKYKTGEKEKKMCHEAAVEWDSTNTRDVWQISQRVCAEE